MLKLKEIDKLIGYLEESKRHLEQVVGGTIDLDYAGMRQLIAQMKGINTYALMQEAITLRKLKSNIDKLVVKLSS